MKASFQYILRTERPRPDGSAIIYLRLFISRRKKPMYSMYRNIPLKAKFKNLTVEQIETYPIKRAKGDTKTITRDQLYCWDKSKGRALRGFGSAESLNQFLNEEMVRADDIVNDLAKRRKALTRDSFGRAFKKDNIDKPFYEYCHEQLVVNKDSTLAPETIEGYMHVISKLERYKPGIRMEEIDFKFLGTYYNWLQRSKEDGGLANVETTANKNMRVIRTMILLAIRNDDFLEEHYPFKNFKIGSTMSELTSRDFLEPEEVFRLEKLFAGYYPPSNSDYKRVSKEERKKRLEEGQMSASEYETLKNFLFACYTGLRYSDMFLLNVQEHIKGKWVKNPFTFERKFRHYVDVEAMHKTGKALIVPLIDKAMFLLDLRKQGLAFNLTSNQKTNKNLKTIAKLAKIDKVLSFHVARHTFATTCFLYGIPAEVGQKLLGHKSEKFIQVYTHLTQNVLFHEMDKVTKGFNEHEQLLKVVYSAIGEPTLDEALIEKMKNEEFRNLVQKLSTMKEDKLSAFAKIVA